MELSDLKFVAEQVYGMVLPGFGADPVQRPVQPSEMHRKRIALVKQSKKPATKKKGAAVAASSTSTAASSS